ncbi:branched-chain amino acid ABC transporter permease [Tepidimicrobium xylanilyticum]|uniref:Branched-chain amino acid transport system permease protein n=1 Tax=Tepidimicrobium xylanilyticum TaxID=1123352 RepID=A0A1H2UXH1_9FIRM|nr:branched-chain amino acid ABC transporter permease [Tepidimicrobium xylanilyticum]SDW60698.1 branched-chain amino acid transport system permease protein [Tepidimicrobium xylanilyticum]
MGNLADVLIKLSIATVILYFVIKILSKGFDKITDKISTMDSQMVRKLIYLIVGILLVAPFLISRYPYILRTSIVAIMYVVLALSLNFVLGFAGQLSMGHSAFYGIGAYVTALLMVNFKVSFWIAFIASAIVAGFFGFLLGVPTLRLKGDYLAITTIGFGEILRLILVNWIEVTRGPAGIPGIPSPKIFGFTINNNIGYYYIILLLAFFTVFISSRLLHSRLGQGFIAVRDDEIAAEAMGINSTYLKILAFVLGAAIAGMAGSFFATFVHYVNPDNFTYMESVTILCMVVLGGLGSIPGVILGAIVLTILPEALRGIALYRYAIYGLLLILMMINRPGGMIDMDRLKGGKNNENFRGSRNNKILRRSYSSK